MCILSREEAIKNIDEQLDIILSCYRKDVAIILKSNILSIITIALYNKMPIQNKKFHIGSGFREKWHDENNEALYFDMILSLKYYTSGKIDVILQGEFVDDYISAIDCGLEIQNQRITIPLNYKPGPVQCFVNMIKSFLFGGY